MILVGRFVRWLLECWLACLFIYLPQDCGRLSTACTRVAKIQDVLTALNGNCTEIGTRNRHAGALCFVQKLGLVTDMQVRCALSAGQSAETLLSAGAIKLEFNPYPANVENIVSS